MPKLWHLPLIHLLSCLISACGPGLSVNPVRVLAITPNNTSAQLGASQQFKALAIHYDDSAVDVTPMVVWNRTNRTGSAVINSTGLVDTAGNSPGMISVDATFGALSATTDLKISNFNIATLAGNRTAANTGNGGNALAASLTLPYGVIEDGSGNYLISDASAHVVRRVNPTTGIITAFAGTGTAGNTGNGGPATAANLNGPSGLAMDQYGDIYIANTSASVIRKVSASTGEISAVTSGFIWSPRGITFDADGNLYAASYTGCVIYKVTPSGTTTVVAGIGLTASYTGDGGLATAATLNLPMGVAIDDAGNLYIADYSNHAVRKVTASTGIITTIAGTGVSGYSGDGGPGVSAQLNGPMSVWAKKNGDVYIADSGNHVIRKVSASTGSISTIAGTGAAGFSGNGGEATDAQMNSPAGITLSSKGNLLVTEASNYIVRILNPQ